MDTNGLDNISVSIDRTKFSQVLRNLVSNALKFTPTKGKVSVVSSIVTEMTNDDNIVFADNVSLSSSHSYSSDATTNSSTTSANATLSNAISRRRTYSEMINNKSIFDDELSHAKQKQQFVRITISDTGPGINKVSEWSNSILCLILKFCL